MPAVVRFSSRHHHEASQLAGPHAPQAIDVNTLCAMLSAMKTGGLLLLGVGQVGMAVANVCRGRRRIAGTTRQPMRVFDLFHDGIEPIVMARPCAEIIASLADNADVLVSFPPDGTTDAILAPGCMSARSLVYISSTGVYGRKDGTIDDTTPVDEQDEHAALRLEAEKIWRSIGATVLRPPGIYGPHSGLHKRLSEGTYKLPADGSRTSSRIHVDDLAMLILAALESGIRQETYVVGDLCPAPQAEVVSWLCSEMGLPIPESAPLEMVHHTQRANRAVDPSRALAELKVRLHYPTYKEGYLACLSACASETA